MSAEIRDGKSPDVEEAMIALPGAARSAAANRSRFNSSRSGALSCTRSTPATASSSEPAIVNPPSRGGGASDNRARARRAFSSITSTPTPAPGLGSNTATSWPSSTNRAAQPPPITPPPSSPTLVTTNELELCSYLVRAKHTHVHAGKNRHRPLDQVSV